MIQKQKGVSQEDSKAVTEENYEAGPIPPPSKFSTS